MLHFQLNRAIPVCFLFYFLTPSFAIQYYKFLTPGSGNDGPVPSVPRANKNSRLLQLHCPSCNAPCDLIRSNQICRTGKQFLDSLQTASQMSHTWKSWPLPVMQLLEFTNIKYSGAPFARNKIQIRYVGVFPSFQGSRPTNTTAIGQIQSKVI